MKLKFSKMHGCGNDYIYFNCLNQSIPNPEDLAKHLSQHHFSVGADGVVLICNSNTADCKMRMFNADGSEGAMCGNAIRCVAKFMVDGGFCNKNALTIETLSGIKKITVEKNSKEVVSATVDMGSPSLKPNNIPLSDVNFTQPVVDYPLEIDGQTFKITCVSMGNPHCVVFCNNLNKLNLAELGPKFEKNTFFKNGVNTEFVKIKSSTEIDMRVFERGSGETLACGTGACAAVVASILHKFCQTDSFITVNLLGGQLFVKQTNVSVFLKGPAVLAFEGFVEI